MFIAEFYFQNNNYDLALNGDGQFSGFLTIADSYSSTKSGNLANYYAAICLMNLGKNYWMILVKKDKNLKKK